GCRSAPGVRLGWGVSRGGVERAEQAAGLVRRPTLTAPPHAGVSDARVGTKKRAFRSNKETDEGKGCAAPPKLLDKPHTRKSREGIRGRFVTRYGDLIGAGDARDEGETLRHSGRLQSGF